MGKSFVLKMRKIIDLRKYPADKGAVTEKETDKTPPGSLFGISEFFDVYTVANGKKPLAALNFSTDARRVIDQEWTIGWGF